ncbi:hypothetical protein KFK14_18095 [Sphingobium phenoxybenzoativorans]|uniref:Uncharacterized protein n=1 Tax=Sphingobium phenoxybenzoativorans TaxID=1592790 RepID=A0A975Q0N0_9SPHN|nr:hypothetical protein [Sphingobium phenoxybenzoativorans]QUT04914.1 hypothetical protein KFK14_18095 [Sphingobium phenoxybenzoativorans]
MLCRAGPFFFNRKIFFFRSPFFMAGLRAAFVETARPFRNAPQMGGKKADYWASQDGVKTGAADGFLNRANKK